MIERTEDCLGLCPERLAADSAYGSAEMLGWLVNERAIEPHIPVFDKSARDDGTFARGDFNYDQEADIYVCPAGKVLTSTGTLVNDGATLLYRASKYDCDACELKPRCGWIGRVRSQGVAPCATALFNCLFNSLPEMID